MTGCSHGRRPTFRAGLAAIGVCVLGLFLSPTRAAETTGPLQQFLAAQTNLQTWSAELTQTRHLKTLAQPLVSTGRVWFAAPNEFRWEIGAPAQTIAVRGRDEMLVIYPRLKRVEKYPINSERSGQWKDTLALLEAGFPRSQAEIEKRFNVVSVSATDGTYHVHLQPKTLSARRMMPKIVISFGASDSALKATELHFGDGSIMRNEFRNAVVNPKLDRVLFQPQLEPDFQVVEPMARAR